METDWNKLKDNQCPKCGKKIFRRYNENYRCDNCGFYCRLGRAKQILIEVDQRNKDKLANEFLKKHGINIPTY
jgi:ribosomal protein L37AE/L43A